MTLHWLAVFVLLFWASIFFGPCTHPTKIEKGFGLAVVDRADAIEKIGLLTTDPRWSHIESSLLLEFALTFLDSLTAGERE